MTKKNELHDAPMEVPGRDPDGSVLIHIWENEGTEVVADVDGAGKIHAFFEKLDMSSLAGLFRVGSGALGRWLSGSDDVEEAEVSPYDGPELEQLVVHLEDPEFGNEPTEEHRLIAREVFQAVYDRCRKNRDQLDPIEIEDRINDALGEPWQAHVVSRRAVLIMAFEDPTRAGFDA